MPVTLVHQSRAPKDLSAVTHMQFDIRHTDLDSRSLNITVKHILKPAARNRRSNTISIVYCKNYKFNIYEF